MFDRVRCEVTVVLVLDVREAVVRTRRRSSLSRRSTDLEMIKKVRLVQSKELQFIIMIALSEVWWQPGQHHCRGPSQQEPGGVGPHPDPATATVRQPAGGH